MRVFCRNSQVLEERKDFVAFLTLRSPPKWVLGTPLSQSLLLTAPSPFRAIHRTMAGDGLNSQPPFQAKLENTNSRYSE